MTKTGPSIPIAIYASQTAPWGEPLWTGTLEDYWGQNRLDYDRVREIETMLMEHGAYALGHGTMFAVDEAA